MLITFYFIDKLTAMAFYPGYEVPNNKQALTFSP